MKKMHIPVLIGRAVGFSITVAVMSSPSALTTSSSGTRPGAPVMRSVQRIARASADDVQLVRHRLDSGDIVSPQGLRLSVRTYRIA